MNILKEHCEEQLDMFSHRLQNIALTSDEMKDLEHYHEIQSRKLVQKQRKKANFNQNTNFSANSLLMPTRRTSNLETSGMDEVSTKLSQSNVVDISKTLSMEEIGVLSKGLNFCPTNNTINELELHKDLSEFSRRMRIRHFFADNNAPDTGTTPLRAQSTWTPEPEQAIELDLYLKTVTQEIISQSKTAKRPINITFSESRIISNLSCRNDIVIKEADKGGSIVIWPIDKYKHEAYRQLNNPEHYRKLDNDPTLPYTLTITNRLKSLLADELITLSEFKFLKPSNRTAGRFYLLPKIHKVPPTELYTANIPGRPIVSNNNTPTESLSTFLNHFLGDFPKTLPSFVQDTPHLLRIMEDINTKGTLPQNIILATLDVTALYTNIPIPDGLSSIKETLSKHNAQHSIEVYLSLLELVLTYNYFEFAENYYLQIHGTSMGTPFAPTYANIFMGSLETEFLSRCTDKPHTYLRYIDDIFIIWGHGQDSLDKFVTFLNSFHPTIKFTSESSTERINFLDTTIYIDNGTLKTTLYRKPFDKQQYLEYTSHHPRHCKQGIFKGQATRLRRICVENDDYIDRLNHLKETLSNRNHPTAALQKAYTNATKLDRAEVLKPRPKITRETTPLLTTKFSNALPNVNNILNKYYPILTSNQKLKKIFPDPPRVAYRRNTNFKDVLVHAKLRTKTNPTCGPCGRPRCSTCKHIQSTTTVKSTASDYLHKITSSFTCTSSNVIYCLECAACKKQYIGETGQQIHTRLNGHRADTKHNLPKAVASHFNEHGHIFDKARLYILQTNFRSPRERKYTESYLIHKFKCLHPTGINLARGNLESLKAVT